MKKIFLNLIFLFLLGCYKLDLINENNSIFSTESKPNVLLISIDDLKDWVGFLDGYEGKVYTPNIDKLASKGVAFTNAHTAASVCCPSRNSFMLGKRGATTGLYNNNQWWKAVYPNEVPIPQYFKQNGYYVAGAGKNFHHTPGNNPPCSWDEYQDQIFDDTWSFSSWSTERYFLTYGYRGPINKYPDWKPLNKIKSLGSEGDWGPIPNKNDEDYGDIHAVNFAKKFLKKEHLKPFFLATGIYKPHLPWHVPQKYYDLYPLEEIIIPPKTVNDLDDLPPMGKKLAKKRSKDYFIIKNSGKIKNAIQAYLASITFADDQVGKILESLEKSKYSKNTIVILWSDHGWHLGSKDHWHKSTLWEESTRIPFIIKAPNSEGNGKKCHKPIDMVNVFPTLISLCTLNPKNDLDGYDMSSLLTNPKSNWNYPAITEFGEGNMAVRTENWRYIRYSDGSEELYDLKNDPYEWKNIENNKFLATVKDRHSKWIPKKFAGTAPGKNTFYFDPYKYTFLNRTTKDFIDGYK